MPRESGYLKGTEADTFPNLVQCLWRCAGSYAKNQVADLTRQGMTIISIDFGLSMNC